MAHRPTLWNVPLYSILLLVLLYIIYILYMDGTIDSYIYIYIWHIYVYMYVERVQIKNATTPIEH